MGCLGTFADLSQGLVLGKAGIAVQLDPSHMHPAVRRGIKQCYLSTLKVAICHLKILKLPFYDLLLSPLFHKKKHFSKIKEECELRIKS